jgi:hypothetical protein
MTVVVCFSCLELERGTRWVPSLQGFIERYGWAFLYAGCRTYYGPRNEAFGALDAEKEAAFTRDLLALMESRNHSGDRTLVVPSEYLEVVIERK